MLTVAAIRSSKKGGDPVAVAAIERMQTAPSPGANAPIEPANPQATPDKSTKAQPPRSDASEIEAQSGVKVVRQNGGSAPSATVIRVPDSASTDNGRQALAAAPDPRISERAQYGILPRVGEGGLMARKLYARPFAASNKPKIAVVLTGVGISAKGTADAISKLPGEFTLAFAPYGRDLEAQVLRARRDGHEVMLQIPMEPFYYPDNDPGPHTLRAGAAPKDNIERMHWLLSRFSGYVGVMNFMGGKVMANGAAFQPLLEEMQRRGLMFLDDGNSRRSMTSDLSRKVGLPALKADRIVEGSTTPASLMALLGEVESIATKTGRAVIAVPALPSNIEALSAWGAELAQRGIVVAPVSALINGSN